MWEERAKAPQEKSKDFSVLLLTEKHREAVLEIERKTRDEYPVAQYLGSKVNTKVYGVHWYGRLVGYCTVKDVEYVREIENLKLDKDVKCLDDVVVDPDWRGLGAGSTLVQEVIEKEGTLYCTPAHTGLNSFYEKLGFTQVDTYLMKREPKREMNSFR